MRLTSADTELARFIYHSELSECIALGLLSVFSKLPKELDYDPRGRKTTAWAIPNTLEAASPFTTMTLFMTFTSQLVAVAHENVARRICTRIYRDFLVPYFVPHIHQEESNSLVAVIAYLEACIARCTAPRLLFEFIQLIFHTTYDDAARMPAQTNSVVKAASQSTRDALVEKIDSKLINLSMAAMNLFHTLLNLNCEDVLFYLCVSDLHRICTSSPFCLAKYVVPKTARMHDSARWFLSLRPSTPDSPMDLTFDGYCEAARSTIASSTEAVRTWTSVYPIASPSFESALDGPLVKLSNNNGSGKDKVKTESSTSPSVQRKGLFTTLKKAVLVTAEALQQPSRDQRVAPKFIRCLFNRLAKSIDQPFACNLLTTGLITRLAMYPVPVLRCFLTDPNFCKDFVMDSPSLFDVLSEVANCARAAEQEEGFHALTAEKGSAATRSDVDVTASAVDRIVARTSTVRQQSLDTESLVEVSSSIWDAAPIASRVPPRNARTGRPGSPYGTASEISVADTHSTSTDQLDLSSLAKSPANSAASSQKGLHSPNIDVPSQSSATQSRDMPKTSSPQVAAANVELEKRRRQKLVRARMAIMVIEEFLKEMAATCLEHAACSTY